MSFTDHWFGFREHHSGYAGGWPAARAANIIGPHRISVIYSSPTKDLSLGDGRAVILVEVSNP